MSNTFAVGFFDDPTQTQPTYDPGTDVDCPVCHKPLDFPATPIRTISLMPFEDRVRSYFYRMHRDCMDRLSPEEQEFYDGTVIDEISKGENGHEK